MSFFFFFSSRRRHTRSVRDWSSDVCSSDLYPVETLLELLSSGMTIDEILADYQDLERDDLLAVLAFAARLPRTRRPQPVGSSASALHRDMAVVLRAMSQTQVWTLMYRRGVTPRVAHGS